MTFRFPRLVRSRSRSLSHPLMRIDSKSLRASNGGVAAKHPAFCGSDAEFLSTESAPILGGFLILFIYVRPSATDGLPPRDTNRFLYRCFDVNAEPMYFLKFFSSSLPHFGWVKAAPGNVIYKDVFALLGGRVRSFVPKGLGKLFMQIFLKFKSPNETGLKNPVARELFYEPVNDCPLKSWWVCFTSLGFAIQELEVAMPTWHSGFRIKVRTTYGQFADDRQRNA